RASADIRREGNKIVAELNSVPLPDVFSRRLDVTDFSTPVQFVDALSTGGKTRIVIEPVDGEFEYLAYQTDKILSINVTRPAAGEVAARSKEPLYTGEKLSLNFQDI
ncbi:MAG TPA: type IV pilus secretin PilQ, partial [Oceanospirillales bacterium]|nr:type IV pilus secretin PilQ [Oceanospirillales bacterium]